MPERIVRSGCGEGARALGCNRLTGATGTLCDAGCRRARHRTPARIAVVLGAFMLAGCRHSPSPKSSQPGANPPAPAISAPGSEALLQEATKRELTAEELRSQDGWGLTLIRTAPFAHHGYGFGGDPSLVQYFHRWGFSPAPGSAAEAWKKLSDLERYNVALVLARQQAGRLFYRGPYESRLPTPAAHPSAQNEFPRPAPLSETACLWPSPSGALPFMLRGIVARTQDGSQSWPVILRMTQPDRRGEFAGRLEWPSRHAASLVRGEAHRIAGTELLRFKEVAFIRRGDAKLGPEYELTPAAAAGWEGSWYDPVTQDGGDIRLQQKLAPAPGDTASAGEPR